MSWNDDKIELLKKLWKEGLSAGQIAAQLGDGLSRSAVIGKLHRIGQSKRDAPLAKRQGRPQMSRAQRAMIRAKNREKEAAGTDARIKALPPRFVASPVASTEFPAPGSGGRKTLDALGERDCRWPYGDGPFEFCGHAKVIGKPYCGYHCQVAYAPERVKGRDAANRVPVAAGGQTVSGADQGSAANDNGAQAQTSKDLEGVE